MQKRIINNNPDNNANNNLYPLNIFHFYINLIVNEWGGKETIRFFPRLGKNRFFIFAKKRNGNLKNWCNF